VPVAAFFVSDGFLPMTSPDTVRTPHAGGPDDRVHWRTLISDALRGRGAAPTEGPLISAILLLAIPMVLEMVMESVFAVVDIFFVSRLGAAAVTGVGLTESLLTIVYTLAMGLSIGVTAIVSRRIGEQRPEAAGLAAGQAITLTALVASSIGVLAAWQAPALLRLMGAEPDVVAQCAMYARILLGGNVVILLLFVLNAAFRGAGDAAIAMRVLWLANGLNIVLDPLLIFGIGPFPELGVTGAAVATTIGRGTAVCVQLWTLFALSDRIRVRWVDLRPRLDLIGRLLRLSATGTFQIFIGMASWILLVRIMASFGTEAVAGYTVAIRVVLFALLPAWGLSNAAATMMGQNLGAGLVDRARDSVWVACRLNFVFLGATGLVMVLLAPGIVGVFGLDGEAAGHAATGLRIIASGFLFYAYGMTLTQAFNGAGDAWTPTWINLACFWCFEIPAAAWMAYSLGWGPTGVFVAVAVSYSVLAVVSGVLFRRGRWASMEV
jgi:putative MATE family efflux protein